MTRPPRPASLGGFFMSSSKSPTFPLTLLIGACSLWMGLLIFGFVRLQANACPNTTPLVDAGQFGDMFGVLNALFSGVAMCGAIYALILQGWQNQDQKKHDRDLLRREKMELLATKICNYRSALYSHSYLVGSWLGSYSDDGQDPILKQRIEKSYQSFASMAMEISLFAGIYFPSHVSMVVPDSIHAYDGYVVPTMDLLKAKSADEAMLKFDVFEAQSAAVIDRCQKCLEYLVEKSELMISQDWET